MHSDLLEQFINNPNILYVYEIGLQIYGLFEGIDDRDFILVSKDNYIPEDFIQSGKVYVREDDNCHFYLYFVEDWFEEVLNCSIVAWECACLPKKYILKEHVKLLLQTDPLKLRISYNKIYKDTLVSAEKLINEGNIISGEKEFWYLIKYVMFANQIIENHKIINFKEPAESYRLVVNGMLNTFDEIFTAFQEQIKKHLSLFKESTTGIYEKYKRKLYENL